MTQLDLSGPEVRQDDVAARHWLWSGLRDLPPRQREALVLRYYEARSATEAAEILGCSAAAVKWRTNHGLRRLSSRLGPDAVLILQRIAR